jgi:hypothetical protein
VYLEEPTGQRVLIDQTTRDYDEEMHRALCVLCLVISCTPDATPRPSATATPLRTRELQPGHSATAPQPTPKKRAVPPPADTRAEAELDAAEAETAVTQDPLNPRLPPPKHMPPTATIGMQRLATCRSCDRYAITLHADGRYDITGMSVKAGSQSRRVPASAVRALWAKLHALGFFGMSSRPAPRDAPSAKVLANWPGGSNAVTHVSYPGPRYPLARFADTIDKVVNVERHLLPMSERPRGL